MRNYSWIAGTVILLLVSGFIATQAYARPSTTIPVTTFDDVTANDGLCSLREAVTAANSDSPSGSAPGECPAGDGADFISLPSGTYPLTVLGHDATNATGDLDVHSDISIFGTDPTTITLACPDGCLHDRLIQVFQTGTLAIYDLTLYRGRAFGGADLPPVPPAGEHGGAILSHGNLVVARVRFIDNQAGDGNFDIQTGHSPSQGGSGGAVAIHDGIFSISDSVFTGNYAGDGVLDPLGQVSVAGHGGAVYQWWQTSGTIARSVFLDNGAGDTPIGGSGNNFHGGGGGGIFTNGILSVDRSAFAGNVSGSGPFGGDGGAIFVSVYGDLTLLSSTVSGNRTGEASPVSGRGGGIFLAAVGQDAAGATIRHSTVAYNSTDLTGAGNGGGIHTTVTGYDVTVENSIIANNRVGGGADGADCFGPLTSGGYLFLEETGGCIVAMGTGDVTGVEPVLLPLADNGGETLTHALDVSSPALDAGNCPGALFDQRGEPRPVDLPGVPNGADGCDMGAFEAQNTTPPPTSTMTPTATATKESATPTITVTTSGNTPTVTVTQTATSAPPAEPKLYLPMIQRAS